MTFNQPTKQNIYKLTPEPFKTFNGVGTKFIFNVSETTKIKT